MANRTDACFIRVIGSELVQKYVGEGARMVRELFQVRARSPKLASPCRFQASWNSCRLRVSQLPYSRLRRNVLGEH